MVSFREKFIFILFVFCLFVVGKAWGSGDCTHPDGSAIVDFFQGVEHWTEVSAEDLNRPAENKPLEFFINFSNYRQSKIFMDGRDMGSFDQVCLGENNQLVVHAQGRAIYISRTSYGLKSVVAFFTFHYRPHSEIF